MRLLLSLRAARPCPLGQDEITDHRPTSRFSAPSLGTTVIPIQAMDTPDQREKKILEIDMQAAAGARAACLEQACGGDAQLRQRIIDAILRAREDADTPPPSSPSQETIRLAFPDSQPGEKPGEHIGRYKLPDHPPDAARHRRHQGITRLRPRQPPPSSFLLEWKG